MPQWLRRGLRTWVFARAQKGRIIDCLADLVRAEQRPGYLALLAALDALRSEMLHGGPASFARARWWIDVCAIAERGTIAQA